MKINHLAIPAPPLACIQFALRVLRNRVERGEYPPAGWIESLEVIKTALEANEQAQLEIIGQTDIVSIDPAGIDVTAFVGSTVTVETLCMLQSETARRYGETWQLFADLASTGSASSGDLWRVTGLRAVQP